MTPEVVFDGDRLRAVLFRGRSDRTIVTFDYRQDGRDGFTPDSHSTGFARQGFGQLCLKTRANDWYVNDETAALEAVLAGLALGRTQALGFSMGGYGALRFARALRLAQAVVVSPQVSPVAAWDGRYRAEVPGWDEALGALPPLPGLKGLIVFDPFVAEDLVHVRAIRASAPGLTPVRLPFGGHPAIRTLRGAGGMRVVQAEAGARTARGAAIRAAHRAAREGSRGWWLRLGDAAGARHPGCAAAARARAEGLPVRPGDLDGA
ncbi:alpha/beta hydrolase [Rubellimicrobium roseum]|uniref:Alpha/beta hydrolase n=1 Tax=Rubellimicrobium roseum TaxID=687525 RepID=A0A5C4NIL5_9RHOB|nr:alpha/beta hydrolase [Rubellimicrobium roseum]TNC74621.1 alpha/beta hydrolase [Rubellimicrobium roseum]